MQYRYHFPNKILFSNFFAGYIINYFCCCLGFVCGTRALSSGAVNSQAFSITFSFYFYHFLWLHFLPSVKQLNELIPSLLPKKA